MVAGAGASSDRAGPLETYRRLVQRIAEELIASGHRTSALTSFLADPPPPFDVAFAGVTLDGKGRLDVERVVENLAAGKPALARARAYEALDAFVSYALFSAKNVLPPEEAARLQRELRSLRKGGGAG
jgi:hypothetical protein